MNVDWAQSQWTEMGDNTLSCNMSGAQTKIATPWEFSAACTSMAIELQPNFEAVIPLEFTNVSSETHASFTSLGFAAYSSLNAKVYFYGSHTGSLTSNETGTLTLVINTAMMSPGTSFNGSINIQSTDGLNGQAYLPLQLSIVPQNYPNLLPLDCSPQATATPIVPGSAPPPPSSAIPKAIPKPKDWQLRQLQETIAPKSTSRSTSSSTLVLFLLVIAIVVVAGLCLKAKIKR